MNIPKKLAIKLKEIGYNEPCSHLYRGDHVELNPEEYTNTSIYFKPLNKWQPHYMVSAPTFEEVKLWLMREHLIFVTVNCVAWMSDFEAEIEWADGLNRTTVVHEYEEAFTDGIEEAIKLILDEQ